MLILFSILLLLLTALSLLAIHLTRPKSSFTWLFASLAFLFSWPMLLLSQMQLPFTPQLLSFPVNKVTWSFSLGLGTLALAAALTDLAHPENRGAGARLRWSTWPIALLLTAFTLLSFLPASLPSLLLAWAALDLVELCIWLALLPAGQRERAMIAFSIRMLGLFLAVFAAISAQVNQASLELASLQAPTSLLLLLAASLRLGLAPPNAPLPPLSHNRSLNALLHFAPYAASLAVMARALPPGLNIPYHQLILFIVAIAGLYGSFAWLNGLDETQSLPFFTLGMASLAAASALHSQPQASLSWSLAGLLGGGALALYSVRRRWLLPLVLIAWVWISGLPFTPGWVGLNLYQPPLFAAAPLFLLVQFMLLLGFLKHSLRPEPPARSRTRALGLAALSLGAGAAAGHSFPDQLGQRRPCAGLARQPGCPSNSRPGAPAGVSPA